MDKKKKTPKANGDADKIYKKRCAVYERVAITLFISAIFFVGLCLVFLKRPEFSEIEKRKLAEKPELKAILTAALPADLPSISPTRCRTVKSWWSFLHR